jgi:hypothetical protein
MNRQLRLLLMAHLIFAAAVTYVSAQNTGVEIQNIAKEDRKICIYDINDQIGIIPKRCFVMKKGESVIWNREGNPYAFMVKIFKPQFLDKYLYTRRLPANTTTILVGDGGRFGYSTDERKPDAVKYILKVCNQQYNEDVYFTLGFETAKVLFAEGWWKVNKGKCLDFPVSQKLKQGWNVDYGIMPTIYYYARTYGNSPLYWSGDDKMLCIDPTNTFQKNQYVGNATGELARPPCNGNGEKAIGFRSLPEHKANEQYYYLTF